MMKKPTIKTIGELKQLTKELNISSCCLESASNFSFSLIFSVINNNWS